MNLDIVDLLLDKNASLFIRNKAGKRPIDLISMKDKEKALKFLESIAARSGKLTQANADVVSEKLAELQHDLENTRLKDKWNKETNKVGINEKNARNFKRRNYANTGRDKVQLLTVEDKLEYSLENALQYPDEQLVDFENLSVEMNENEQDFEQLNEALVGIDTDADENGETGQKAKENTTKEFFWDNLEFTL